MQKGDYVCRKAHGVTGKFTPTLMKRLFRVKTMVSPGVAVIEDALDLLLETTPVLEASGAQDKIRYTVVTDRLTIEHCPTRGWIAHLRGKVSM